MTSLSPVTDLLTVYPSDISMPAHWCLKFVLPLTAYFALSCYSSVSRADSPDYPNRAVKLIVPYPLGGGTDITARAMTQQLNSIMKQSVVIENRPGVTGMIGAASVAKSPSDGYTILYGAASEMAINTSLFKTMMYNPKTDLEAVSLITTFPLILVVSASSSATLESLMKRANEQPGAVTYGSIGSGSPQHLAGELLASSARTSLVHVSYKGSGPLVQDTMGGVVDIGISSLPPAINLIKAGKLRALAVTSATRVASLPDVPTMQELGYQGYEFNTWVGAAVPIGTPRDIILKINQSLRTALASDEIKKIFLDQGAEPVGSTPAFFKTFIHNQIAKSAEIVSKVKVLLK